LHQPLSVGGLEVAKVEVLDLNTLEDGVTSRLFPWESFGEVMFFGGTDSEERCGVDFERRKLSIGINCKLVQLTVVSRLSLEPYGEGVFYLELGGVGTLLKIGGSANKSIDAVTLDSLVGDLSVSAVIECFTDRCQARGPGMVGGEIPFVGTIGHGPFSDSELIANLEGEFDVLSK
jgi:hypothetical protein